MQCLLIFFSHRHHYLLIGPLDDSGYFSHRQQLLCPTTLTLRQQYSVSDHHRAAWPLYSRRAVQQSTTAAMPDHYRLTIHVCNKCSSQRCHQSAGKITPLASALVATMECQSAVFKREGFALCLDAMSTTAGDGSTLQTSPASLPAVFAEILYRCDANLKLMTMALDDADLQWSSPLCRWCYVNAAAAWHHQELTQTAEAP